MHIAYTGFPMLLRGLLLERLTRPFMPALTYISHLNQRTFANVEERGSYALQLIELPLANCL